MKVLIIHSYDLYRDFYNSICAMVRIYSLTGPASDVVPPQLATQPGIAN